MGLASLVGGQERQTGDPHPPRLTRRRAGPLRRLQTQVFPFLGVMSCAVIRQCLVSFDIMARLVSRVALRLPLELRVRLDEARGDVSLNTAIVRAVEAYVDSSFVALKRLGLPAGFFAGVESAGEGGLVEPGGFVGASVSAVQPGSTSPSPPVVPHEQRNPPAGTPRRSSSVSGFRGPDPKKK